MTELKKSGNAHQFSKTLTWIEERSDSLADSLSIDLEFERKACEELEISNIKRCEQLETELSRVKLTSNKVIFIPFTCIFNLCYCLGVHQASINEFGQFLYGDRKT